MAFLAFQALTRHCRGNVDGTQASKDNRFSPAEAPAPRPKVVNEFDVRGRGVALRMRVERWPAPIDPSDDDPPSEAGYGHGV